MACSIGSALNVNECADVGHQCAKEAMAEVAVLARPRAAVFAAICIIKHERAKLKSEIKAQAKLAYTRRASRRPPAPFENSQSPRAARW